MSDNSIILILQRGFVGARIAVNDLRRHFDVGGSQTKPPAIMKNPQINQTLHGLAVGAGPPCAQRPVLKNSGARQVAARNEYGELLFC